MKNPIFSLFLLSLVALNACSTTGIKQTDQKTPIAQSNHIVAIDLGKLQSLQTITPQLAKHKSVFVGEVHTRYGDHLNQLAVIKTLHKPWGNKTSIGLEMIQQPYQHALDNFIAGKINERDMLQQTQWYDRWQYDFRLYRPIFTYAKANKIPLVALNIPRELTQRITKVGIKGLNKTERQYLPNRIDRSNPRYIKRIKTVFNGHMRTSSKNFDKFLDAQLAWDEGMAYAAAKYLKNNPSQRMIILAGGGHIINREGIPDRLGRLTQSRPAVVLNNIQGAPNARQGDFLLFSPEIKLPEIGLIGIHMKPTSNNLGVLVSGLSQHGAAKKAGIKKGDIIQRLNNRVIKSLVDIKLAIENKKPGDKISVTLKRNNRAKTIPLKLGKRRIMSMAGFHKTSGKARKRRHGK